MSVLADRDAYEDRVGSDHGLGLKKMVLIAKFNAKKALDSLALESKTIS